MFNEPEKHKIPGTLTYLSEWNCFELDGYELHSGDYVELSVFGSWIPGQIARDATGWYLFTPDQVSIRLHSGLPARLSASRTTPMSTGFLSSGKKLSLLLVDDDPALLQALPHALSLRLPEVKVETSDSAQAALALLRTHDYDAIISDIKMPGMDGLELLVQIQELRPETPTLLITGHGEHDLAIRALRGGAYDYIQKPIDRDDFFAAVRRALHIRQLSRQVREQQLNLELHAKSLEQLVQQRTQELVEANAIKDKVINVVSQDLHLPLTRLKDITQLLRRKLQGREVSELVDQGLADIERTIGQEEELVQALLNTSRIETTLFILHREQCDLVALCSDVLEHHAAGTGSALNCEFLGGPVDIELDTERISHLLLLLLSQAGKNAVDGDPITIAVQQAGQEAIIAIRGIGFQKGWGAGLYISRKIVERHGGHLEIQSFPEQRSACFIMLPLLIDPALAIVNVAARTHAMWAITPKIENISS